MIIQEQVTRAKVYQLLKAINMRRQWFGELVPVDRLRAANGHIPIKLINTAIAHGYLMLHETPSGQAVQLLIGV